MMNAGQEIGEQRVYIFMSLGIEKLFANLSYKMKEQTYQVKDYLRYRVVNGVEQILLSWVGFKEKTWEPLESLFLTKDDEGYMKVIRDKYRAIKQKYEKKGINTDGLEIINPHLPKANSLQAKLNALYNYIDSESSSGADQFYSESQEDSPEHVNKTKIVRKSKQERRNQIIKNNAERHRISKITAPQPHKEQTRNFISNDGLFFQYPPQPRAIYEHPSPQPKAIYEHRTFPGNDIKNNEFKWWPKIQKDFDSTFEREERIQKQDQFGALLMNKLLQNSKIKDSFRRKFSGSIESYYEVQLSYPGFDQPILVPESIIKRACPNQLETFLFLKNVRK